MIQALLNFFGMSQSATVACFIVFLVVAIASGAADAVFIVQEHKRRTSERAVVSDVSEDEPEEESEPEEELLEEQGQEEPYAVSEAAVAQDDYVPGEDSDEDEDDEDEGYTTVSDETSGLDDAPVIIADAAGGKVTIRYNRSFTAKLIQASPMLKNYYSVVKNELLRYGVKSRISWRHETFRKGRKLLAKMSIRGKTLYLYLALDPNNYAGSKYKIRDASSVSANSSVPTLYRIKNDRRCRYAKVLIAELMAAEGLAAGSLQNVDYASQFPYEDLQTLIDKNLVTYTEYVA